jgi:hypothetical protein
MKKRSLLVVSILCLFVLAGCAQAAATAMPGVISKSANESLGVAGAPVAATAAPFSDLTAAGTPNSTTQNAGQMVIQNASLNILVDDPMKTLAAIMKLATDMGGFTVTSNSYQTYTSAGEQVPEAAVTIRVPSEKLNDALDQIKAMTGDASKYVTNESVSGEDVTQAYTDLQSRLRNLEAAEVELQKMYDKAVNASDVLAIYNQIMQVNEQIEVLKGQIQYYEQASAKSAISVQISAKASVQPVTIAGWEPKGVARNAVQALINFGKGLVDFLIWLAIYIIPVLVVIGLPIFFFIRWLVRRNRREQEKRRQMPPLPVEKKE